MLSRDLHEANRLAWNEATRIHNSHKADQAGFLRAGGSTLFPDELELLGDVRGRRLVHLQCNAGQDTLSLACLVGTGNPGDVVGVDISDEAIAFAQQLAHDAAIPATFVRMDVYDWLAQTAQGRQRFDVAYASYGALCWLSDIAQWARGVAAVLAPGGRLVVIEFHPLLSMLEEGWRLTYPYFSDGQPHTWDDGVGDYVAAAGAALAPSGYLEGVARQGVPHPVHEFMWGLGEIVNAVVQAGLRLTLLREYPYTNGDKYFADMRPAPGNRWLPPPEVPSLPMMYGLVAEKP